jgi:mannose-6-phosphate isomerase-like protein (cupin superfamily)
MQRRGGDQRMPSIFAAPQSALHPDKIAIPLPFATKTMSGSRVRKLAISDANRDIAISALLEGEGPTMTTELKRGLTLCNAFNKETFVFSGPVDDPTVARFDVVLAQGGSGGGNGLVHVHPHADEHYTVKAGQIKVVIAGVEHVVGPGEKTVVPRGKPHSFANIGNGPAEVTIELTPAQQHLRFFANFASLAAKQTQWFSKQGDPHFLLIVLVLHAYREHLYLAQIPIFLQKLIFALLSPLARLRGYRMEIEPAD